MTKIDLTIDIETARPAEMVDHCLRLILMRLMAECTQAQNEFFKRVYPKGIDKLNTHDLQSAIGLYQRTIAKNKKGRDA